MPDGFEGLRKVTGAVTGALSKAQQWIRTANWNSTENNPFNGVKTLVDLNNKYREITLQKVDDPEQLKRLYQEQRYLICKNYVKGFQEQMADLNYAAQQYEPTKNATLRKIESNPDMVRRYTSNEIAQMVENAGQKVLDNAGEKFNNFLRELKINREFNVTSHSDRVELCQYLINTYTNEMQKAQQKISRNAPEQQAQDSVENKEREKKIISIINSPDRPQTLFKLKATDKKGK